MVILNLTINPIAFSLGPVQVHWYGIIIATGVLIAVAMSTKEAQLQKIDSDNIYDLLLWGLPIALITARLYYVGFEWSYYSNHLDEIIRIWDGGIAIYGGLIGALLVLIVLCNQRFISPFKMLDIIAPSVLLAQSIGRWGNFINQEAFGGVTSLAFLKGLHLPNFIINEMLIGGSYRQPTFLYESMWSLIGFVILMGLRHRKHFFKSGEIFLSYVTWYSLGRFFIEQMRTDSLMFLGIRVSQILSGILFIGAIILIVYRRKHGNPDWYINDNYLKEN